MSGFITLQRQLLDWEWYKDINTKTLFIHCLLRANWEKTKWKGIDVERGSFITSTDSLSKELNLSIKQVRTAIYKLEKTNEIMKKGASSHTVITVVKYDIYQDNNYSKANKGQTKGKQRATDNNNNNNNNITIDNNIDSRKLAFAHTLSEFIPEFDRELVKDFYDYWTETNEGGLKFRREMQKTWNTKMRLSKWKKNDQKFISNGKSKFTTSPEFNELTTALRIANPRI